MMPLKATILGLLCSSMAFGQVTTMNVYQSNGVLLQVPLSAIDSVTLSTTPPPSMSIYQTGGSVSTIVLANIDSITYTVAGGGSGIISNPGAGVTFDGYTYTSVVLGNGQEWMAENLRTTTYANSDPIPNVTDSTQWSNLSTGAWVHYNNDNQYENPYGKLYNWFTVDDSRNVCPTGWHVPTLGEYMVLIDYLGPLLLAGGMMKSTGTQYWLSPNTDATNESGFSGLPGGMRDHLGSFLTIGYSGVWWSSTERSASPAYWVNLSYGSGFVHPIYVQKGNGTSVRCLKD